MTNRSTEGAPQGRPPEIAITAAELREVPTPCFVIDEDRIMQNCDLLDRVQRESGAKVLLALKGFAAWRLFPAISKKLSGCTCSGLHEALLAHQEFGGEVHVYSPAYSAQDLGEILGIADHVIFNSLHQWDRFASHWEREEKAAGVSRGLRINPQHREVAVEIYDPCAPGSRLGVTAAELQHRLPDGIEGLHFHTLCELGSDALARTLEAIEGRFGTILEDPQLRWFNFGGGHHITKPGYDLENLIDIIRQHRERYRHEVYLEPGEAVALNAGVLIASVLDIVSCDGIDTAILDVSATAHMPDVLEMPYRPVIENAGEPGERAHTIRLGGPTCLAGDIIGDYSFDAPLRVGDRLVFGDMAIYSMVKTTTFNGVQHPAIAIRWSGGETEVVRRFGFEDYRNRLG